MSSMAVMTTSGSMSMSTGMPMAGTDGMNSSSMDVMGMDSMAMVFFTSSTTPLYSWSWTPSNQGQYAGTCIFLIVLAAIFKGLLFLRISTWSVTEVKRWEGDTAQARRSRWRANTAVKIATLDTILAGVGYLL
ncbi:MAG: hypothetical protein GOMPHAMPRED_003968 [Gomphillus americanus]|uniref:Copper transport protein n=1 Tax=Gomphillus americanus TaxID=1940652 RepID=A0A8H3FJQ8_9LECA|nr:MAG: hypothetical protein GOMPHAMPRED_003968 [Gomphillus americanus]